MKKVQHKDIDSVFKHSLTDPANEPGYQPADWDAMDDMLNEVKAPAKPMYWLRVLSGAAATILLAAGWWLFGPQATDDTKNKPQVAIQKIQSKPEVTNVEPSAVKIDASPSTIAEVPKTTGPLNKVPTEAIAINEAKSSMPQENKIKQVPVEVPPVNVDYVAITADPTNTPKTDLATPQQAGVSLAENTDMPVLVATTGNIRGVAAANQPISSDWADDEVKGGKSPRIKTSLGHGPQLALSFIAAPELNGTNALNGASRGTNVGLLFSVGVSKFTFSTGAMYTVKPYSATGGNYYSSAAYYKYGKPVVPQSIAVDCRMLDIPLNVDYQLYNRGSNKFSIGTGLSSYIMTHESYQYSYADAAHAGAPGYTVNGTGKYLFSIMNLQATYQRQLNSKFGVSVQPYFKMPLKNIGYSQVKLQTLGVAVGVNWNINSLSKPK